MTSRAGQFIMGRRLRAIASLACVAALLAGACSNPYLREQTGPPPHRTRGQVLVDGEAAEGVKVTFLPVEGASEENPIATGRTDEQGRFELSTYNAFDGAPTGEYNVVLSWIRILDTSLREEDQPEEAQQLPWKYQDPKHSGLKVTVEEGTNDLEAFEVSTNDDTPRPPPQGAGPVGGNSA